MLALIFVAITAVAGDPMSGDVTVARLGKMHLPEGKWIIEHSYNPTKESKRPDCFVFRKLGDRLERIAIIRYRPEIAQKKASMYADWIADSIGMGVPYFVNPDFHAHARAHDEVEQLGRPKDWNDSELVLTYIYTSKKEAPWMSHSFILLKSDWIVVGVHSSPYAISPDTIRELKDGSEILFPTD